jgi:polysaccharide biosynthesis protein PelG
MTSVNTAIEAMTRRGTLSAILLAYLYAVLLVAGPWIFTVLGLLNLSPTICDDNCTDKTIFRSIVIYNSMYALVVTTPLAFFCGRYASEQLHKGSRETVTAALLIALGVFVFISLVVVVPFYLFATTLEPPEALDSIYNAILIGCSWLIIPFVGALRKYNSILCGFGVGAMSMIIFGITQRTPQAVSLILVFNFSFTLTNLIMLMTVVRGFGVKIVLDPELRARLRKGWELPAAGGAYALGLWIDKVIMWHASPSGALVVAGALRTMPSYDAAMFWAQLCSIPIIAVFFVHVETGFSSLIHGYRARMQQQGSLRELNEIVGKIKSHVIASMFELFSALFVAGGMMIMLSFVFMTDLGLRPSYMGIFRVSVVSMAFYTSAMFCFNFLLHLDLRKQALIVVMTFLLLNAFMTTALLPLGSDLYGYGNMISAAVTLLVGFTIVQRELSWLHYHAFITNNSSL